MTPTTTNGASVPWPSTNGTSFSAPTTTTTTTTTSSSSPTPRALPASSSKHIIIVTGPAGSGKTTMASSVSSLYSIPYLEGDEFHPPSNIEKMASGHPLSDSDRWGWLARVRDAAVGVLTGRTPRSSDSTTGRDDGARGQDHEQGKEERHSSAGERGVDGPTDGDEKQVVVVDPSTHGSTRRSGAGDQHPAEAAEQSAGGARAVVVTCSALKRSYRDVLREVPVGIRVRFVFLSLGEEVLFRRVRERVGHYMKESMVRSQLEVLEVPDEEERRGDTVVVDAERRRGEVEREVWEGVERVLAD